MPRQFDDTTFEIDHVIAGSHGGPRVAGGHGIAGLAERARPLNGTVVAGALDGGGFRLAVTVPVPVRRG